MNYVALVAGLVCSLTPMAARADRLAQVETLRNEYEAAVELSRVNRLVLGEKPSVEERIAAYEAWPGWRFLPRFVELAEARPGDDAAFQCCLWIVDRTLGMGNWDKIIFDADQKAWSILGAHHIHREELNQLCLMAVPFGGPAQIQFLRESISNAAVSHESRGFATVALAELLSHRYDLILSLERHLRDRDHQDAFLNYRERRKAPGWDKDLIPANASSVKDESIQLFGRALSQYGNVPVTISAPYFRDLKNLGEKASKSLHALKHLGIGSTPPTIVGEDIFGKPLDLRDYRGKVVVLSFWFTGCGPCIAMVPQEQRLVEKYEGQPFALLGVCTDENFEETRKTAEKHTMSWPCWFDGTDGPIARDWNVLAWPTVYVLDRSGRIAAKQVFDDELDAIVAELMEEKK